MFPRGGISIVASIPRSPVTYVLLRFLEEVHHADKCDSGKVKKQDLLAIDAKH